jgi:hypothetical protein
MQNRLFAEQGLTGEPAVIGAPEGVQAGQRSREVTAIPAVARGDGALLVAVAGHRRGLLAWLKGKRRQNRAPAS